jgi:pilus assembly protein CpaC
MKEQITHSRKIAARAIFSALCLSSLSAAGFAQNPASASAPVNANPASMAGAMSHIDTKGESLHVLVGRSLFVTTKNRLRRVYVSNPAVLDSFTASPYQIVVTAKAAGVSSLILWNENGESQVYLVSSDIDVDGLRKSLHQALPNDNIVVESREGQVSLSGTVADGATAEAAMKLASAYSKDVADSLLVNPAHTKQVKLRVRFVEIDRSKIDQAGFNFFSIGKNTTNSTTGQFPSTIANSSSGSSSGSSGSGSSTTSSLLALSDPLNILYYNSALGIGSVLKDLETRQVLQILAEPTISSISGQKASFLSGGEFPFPVVQGGTGGFTSVTVQFRPYGVKLDFTPQVTAEGTISLKVAPEVSALDYSNAVTISGYTIPALSTRRAETQVELKDGQSFAISGLLDRRLTDILEKSPGFSSIPILGAFFKSKNYNHAVTELLVIVTPTIVDPLGDTTQPAEPKMPVEMMDPAKFDQQLAPRKPIASVLKP